VSGSEYSMSSTDSTSNNNNTWFSPTENTSNVMEKIIMAMTGEWL
jgi:hypothetical protein